MSMSLLCRLWDWCVSTFQEWVQWQPSEKTPVVPVAAERKTSDVVECKTLIISSGDISDVDGFMALAEYAKTGADVLFVMNYPAYIGVRDVDAADDATFEKENPGMGYKFGANAVLEKALNPPSQKYDDLLGKYRGKMTGSGENEIMKTMMTDMAHFLAHEVWKEVNDGKRGKLYFCVGGINAINPFSRKAIKNEILAYAEQTSEMPSLESGAIEGAMYDTGGTKISDLDWAKIWAAYSSIYMDFNGSMAFFSDDHPLYKKLTESATAAKFKGVFIMGGVYAEEAAKTMPAIAGTLNRYSCATMNQLYHPENTERFFSFVANRKIAAYTVTNNVVRDLTSWADDEHKVKTYDGVDSFLKGNGLTGPFLSKIVKAYYENPLVSQPPRKPFDFYVAFALEHYLSNHSQEWKPSKRLFYSKAMGTTLVSDRHRWPCAIERYISFLDIIQDEKDSDFIKAKKLSFKREIGELRKLEAKTIKVVEVNDLSFAMEEHTKRLVLRDAVKSDWAKHDLIISSGDISDVDGFFALAEYAKTGADVLFVMNYPAYINEQQVVEDGEFEKKHPGLGYKYNAEKVLSKTPDPVPAKYEAFMSRYKEQLDNKEHNVAMKSAMTDMAWFLANRVWSEVSSSVPRGKLFFCIGGVNTVNPFSAKAVKNEVLAYADLVEGDVPRLLLEEGNIYDKEGKLITLKYSLYDRIFVDFNGSMAFFGGEHPLYKAMTENAIVGSIKVGGAFIMGGVYAEEAAKTMPAIAGTLNRYSCATMNQLYHPENAARFFSFLSVHEICAYTVTNNVVCDLTTWEDDAHKVKTYKGVEWFMRRHGLTGDFLCKMARAYYLNPYISQPPRKPFDYYTAITMIDVMTNAAEDASQQVHYAKKWLFYSDKLGITLVSNSKTWAEALKSYTGLLTTGPSESDSPFIKAKKESFLAEVEALRKLEPLPSLTVCDVALHITADHRLSLPRMGFKAGVKAVQAAVRMRRLSTLHTTADGPSTIGAGRP